MGPAFCRLPEYGWRRPASQRARLQRAFGSSPGGDAEGPGVGGSAPGGGVGCGASGYFSGLAERSVSGGAAWALGLATPAEARLLGR